MEGGPVKLDAIIDKLLVSRATPASRSTSAIKAVNLTEQEIHSLILKTRGMECKKKKAAKNGTQKQRFLWCSPR